MPSERRLRIAAGVLAALGFGVALYVALTEFSGGTPLCLAGGNGCETVAQSKYSHLAGINIASIGAGGYVLLFAAAFVRGDPGRFTGLMLALIGFGFSAYLTYLEFFVVDALCQWCVASAILMTLLLAVNAARAYGYFGRAP